MCGDQDCELVRKHKLVLNHSKTQIASGKL
jgi:hypothetical protein